MSKNSEEPGKPDEPEKPGDKNRIRPSRSEALMSVGHFVGRNDAVKRVQDVLTGREAAPDGNLTILSIEGPGGIGKTCLFDHAIRGLDLGSRNYLTLRTNGSDPSARTPDRAVARMVNGARAEVIRGTPGSYFPLTARVVKASEAIRAEAAAEFQRRRPNDEVGRLALLQFLDLAFRAGERINNAFPITKEHVDFHELDEAKRLIEETVPVLIALQQEAWSFWEMLGLGDTALRNAVKENACGPLSEALVSDLAAVLAGYQSKDWFKLTYPKMKGIDRLLLVLDDYEMVQEPLGKFLLTQLLPKLRSAEFQSVVVVIGRDQLTDPAWDRDFKANLLRRIDLDPLSRPEMDQLVESYGVNSQDEKERAWRDTKGFPLYVKLWIEEIESGGRSALMLNSGGRSALMLKKFYDRTTQWMSDRQKGWLQYALFLDEVNVGTMQAMLGKEDEGAEAFNWFQGNGSVRDTSTSPVKVPVVSVSWLPA